jgi:hypothetical protein
MTEQLNVTNVAQLKDVLFDRVPKSLKFENELWTAADNLRASARLKSSEYAAPLLRVVFPTLRFKPL